MIEAILFWILAAMIVASALGVILMRNPVHSAMSLVGTFFLLAALYVLLRAHLVAALQVLVYAGAIMVLFVFVIMLLSLTDKELGLPRRTAFKILGVIASGTILFFATWVVVDSAGAGTAIGGARAVGTVEAVALNLYTEFALGFEIIGVLLLVAVVGAVVVAKRRI